MFAITNEGNPNTLKLLIAAKIAKQSVTVKTVNPNGTPLGRLPVLQLSCGMTIFSTSAAMQFLASTKDIDSMNNQWLEWDITQLQPAVILHGTIDLHKNANKCCCLWSLLNTLNTSLNNNGYLIKEENRISLADISIWITLWSTILTTNIEKEIYKEFPHISSWLTKVETLPVVQDSLKEFNIERGPKAIASIQAGSWFPINSNANAKSNICKSVAIDISTKEKEIESVSNEEINSASKNWGLKTYPDVKQCSYPVLPKKGERNILVTSALPYVNNVPHLGNIIGCVLSADIFARYCRQRNYNTLYISGTDEYGTATEAKAVKEKTTPQSICDKYFNIHNDVYRWFSIGFDYFGRTTTPEQTEIVQSFFLHIQSQGYILTETVDQLLCESCNRFLADRFVEGTCPRCKYEDARGDQCDGCGHLVNATDLENPRCKMCNNRPVLKMSEQFFLDLPKMESQLKEWSSTVEKGWSPIARSVTKPWLRDGLKPRCITRDLKWGIPVPVKGFENKVFYVWFDAPFGYISITKRYTKEFEQWWKPDDVEVSLYQFMAKDNVPFHAIMFPAYLLAANQNYTLIKHLMATEYLNYEDNKFSKSRGIGVFGTDAQETGIPADVWRFYLAYIRPESQDSNFNWEDLATKNNNELLNNLGNFVNRALMFANKYFNSEVPLMDPQIDDMTVLALAQRELTCYIKALEQAKLRDGIKHVLAISKHGNQYMQSQEPWVKVKGTDDDKKKAGTVIGICCNLACLLSALLAPFMPTTSREMRSQLGLNKAKYGYIPDMITTMLPAGHRIGKPTPLFTKIEDHQVEMLRNKYSGRQEGNDKQQSGSFTTTVIDTNHLEAAIAKQGQLVKELKSTKEKSVWYPQVEILLELKKKLADLGSKSNTPNGSAISLKNKNAESVFKSEQNGGATVDVTSLEVAIAKQGALVRDLKTKSEKSVWQPQVEILLNLKKKLIEVTGTIANSGIKK